MLQATFVLVVAGQTRLAGQIDLKIVPQLPAFRAPGFHPPAPPLVSVNPGTLQVLQAAPTTTQVKPWFELQLVTFSVSAGLFPRDDAMTTGLSRG